MSVLVLQPPLLGGSRRRHLALVPAHAPRRRVGSRAGTAPVVVPLALVGDRAPRRAWAAPAPVAQEGAGSRVGDVGRLHVTRRGRLVLTVSALLLVGGVALVALSAASAAPVLRSPADAAAPVAAPAAVETAEVVVLPGDTLWSLADEAAAPGEDVRDVVLRIEELNALASVDVAVGDRLLVPA